MANEKLFHIGVKALITNAQGKVLLMNENVQNHSLPTTPYWDMPGGRMQKGETLEQTLRREVAEETGITDITGISFLASVIANHEIKLPSDEIIGLALMIYTVTIPDKATIVMSDEHTAYDWFSMTEAAKLLTHKYPESFTEQLVR